MQWIATLVLPCLSELGYVTRPFDTPMQILLRSELMRIACKMKDPQCIAHARNEFLGWKGSANPFGMISIDPNYQNTLIETALLHPINEAENLENKKLLTAFLEHEKNQSWQEMYSRIHWIKHDVFGSQDIPNMSERLVIVVDFVSV